MANRYSLDLELGSSQYAYVNDTVPLSITGDMSVECWIKLETLPSVAGTAYSVISKFDTNALRSYRLAIDTADKLDFRFTSDGGATATTVTATSATFAGGDVGAWVHIAATADVSAAAAGVVLYKNASPVSDTDVATGATAIYNSTAPFAIGTRFATGTAGEFYDGLVDEVRVWNDIRSGAEITANYLKEISPSSANLVGYWKLNNAYTDSTTNAATLTASGSPVFSTSVPFVGDTGAFLAFL